MPHIYTDEEMHDWLATQPKKNVAAKALILSETGNILLVKPNYATGWHLPGGACNVSEDPNATVVREVFEEIGLATKQTDFKILNAHFNKEHDSIILIYKYLSIVDEDLTIRLQTDELSNYKFEKLKNIVNLLSDIRLSIAEWNNFFEYE